MIVVDYKCNECGNVFEVSKPTIMDEYPDSPCPECKSSNTYRVWSIRTTNISQGKCGTAKDGYTGGVMNHRSEWGNMKGTRITPKGS